VVAPPWSPDSMKSIVRWRGVKSPKTGWAWESIRPGRRVRSPRSTTSAPGGTVRSGPTAWIRFPWNDASGDKFIQANELDQTRILAYGGNYDPDNPTKLETTGSVDPDIKNDRTREFIVGVDHEVVSGVAVGFSYIWRKYDRFAWNDRRDFTSADYVARSYTPPASLCPAGARCERAPAPAGVAAGRDAAASGVVRSSAPGGSQHEPAPRRDPRGRGGPLRRRARGRAPPRNEVGIRCHRRIKGIADAIAKESTDIFRLLDEAQGGTAEIKHLKVAG